MDGSRLFFFFFFPPYVFRILAASFDGPPPPRFSYSASLNPGQPRWFHSLLLLFFSIRNHFRCYTNCQIILFHDSTPSEIALMLSVPSLCRDFSASVQGFRTYSTTKAGMCTTAASLLYDRLALFLFPRGRRAGRVDGRVYSAASSSSSHVMHFSHHTLPRGRIGFSDFSASVDDRFFLYDSRYPEGTRYIDRRAGGYLTPGTGRHSSSSFYSSSPFFFFFFLFFPPSFSSLCH